MGIYRKFQGHAGGSRKDERYYCTTILVQYKPHHKTFIWTFPENVVIIQYLFLNLNFKQLRKVRPWGKDTYETYPVLILPFPEILTYPFNIYPLNQIKSGMAFWDQHSNHIFKYSFSIYSYVYPDAILARRYLIWQITRVV